MHYDIILHYYIISSFRLLYIKRYILILIIDIFKRSYLTSEKLKKNKNESK